MEFHWKAFSTILQLILLKSIINLECFCSPLPDVTYKDIEDLNATCKGLDSCVLPRRENIIEHCNCGASCNLMGTCCVDSKYRNKYIEPLKNIRCQDFNYRKKVRSLPMISSCDSNVLYDETTENLCKSSGEELNDPFLKIPVTDPVTGISYKNHYCFACNRNNGEEKPVPWNLKLKSDCIHQKLKNSTIPKLHSDGEKWFITLEQEIAIEVYLHTSIPGKLKSIVPHCYFLVWSECASYWSGDPNIKRKCESSYMALTRVLSSDGTFYIEYRNPHCAVCNHHSIDDMECLQTETSSEDSNDDDDNGESDGDEDNGDVRDGNDDNDGDEYNGSENYDDGNEGENDGDNNDSDGDESGGDDGDENEDSENDGDENEDGENDSDKNDDNDDDDSDKGDGNENSADDDESDDNENDRNGGDEDEGDDDESSENNDDKGNSDENYDDNNDSSENDGNEGDDDDYDNDEDDNKNSLKDGIFFVKLYNLQNETDCKDNMVYDYFAKSCRKMPKAQWRKKFG
ncbi:uncharacterized protein [Parasteatoda tepidariorum]|uniref:uncharacterized protein n=1 Tax=Parasteatoda tepidariorum TaxID=114398 RepID=UPI001C71814E|nr:uncharacterized protein LOC107455228 [Parasteatoda tepidariorum]